MSSDQTFIGLPFKYISLISLTLQNSLLAILLHHSRTVSTSKLYSASAAVLLNEILKCFISFLVALYNACNDPQPSIDHPRRGDYHLIHTDGSSQHSRIDPHGVEDHSRVYGNEDGPQADSSEFLKTKSQISFFEHDLHALKQPSKPRSKMIMDCSKQIFFEIISADCWKLSIPAVLYVIQNNLQFIAAANLDVATFSVTYQLKILTTALCSVVMLGRQLSTGKWISLLFLAVGVALVQLQNIPTEQRANKKASLETADRFIGFIAVTSACFTSGLAGVYFELVLKSSNKVDLWIRNIQLSLFSLLPALFTTIFTNSNQNGHMFSNFGFWAWATVLTQVVGGLVTALVIKFADNILKGFATSLSIILSTIAAVFLFGSPLSLGSGIGSLVVLLATYTYNSSSDLPSSKTVSSLLSQKPKGPTGFVSPFRKEKFKQRML